MGNRQGKDSIVETGGSEGQGLPDIVILELGVFSLGSARSGSGGYGLDDASNGQP